MVGSSSSSSSSTDDEKPVEKPREDKNSSGSDFETQPVAKGILKSPKGAKQTPASMNVNVLPAIAKGNSKDFMSKMNAAMIGNFLPKPPVPPKKLNRIGFDNDQSSSSDHKKSPAKKTAPIQIVSRKSSSDDSSSDEKHSNVIKVSPVKSTIIVTKAKNISSSESDSENELNVKKKALLLKNHQENKSKSSSDDSDSDSSDSNKKPVKVVKQISFAKSPVENKAIQKLQIKTPQKSSNVSSDSDSEDDSNNTKRIEEIKRELQKLQTSRKRRKSISEDQVSKPTDSNKSKKFKDSSSNAVKVISSSNDSSSSSSDDGKMTSILTQRETPTRKSDVKSTSGSESDSDAKSDELDGSNKLKKLQGDSDFDDSSILKRDKLFSEFLNEHPDYKEIKIKSALDLTTLNKHEEIYTFTAPKHIPSDLLRNKEFNLDEPWTTLKFGPDKYTIKCEQFKHSKQSLCLVNKNNNTAIVNLDIKGLIKVFKTPENIHISKQINLNEITSDKKVAVPDVKQRHPIFGSDLSKIILNKTVQSRLDSMIEDLSRKLSRSKKNKTNLDKEEDVPIIKEDIYKILNFLHDPSIVEGKEDVNKIDKKIKRKKKSQSNEENKEILLKYTKIDTIAEPPAKKSKIKEVDSDAPKKSKKLKLKLNVPQDIEFKQSEQVLVENPENASKKSKKKHAILANSTFASPFLNANTNLFETNESMIPKKQKHVKKLAKLNNTNAANSSETNGSKVAPSESLKHLEKVIKQIAKGTDASKSIEEDQNVSKNIDNDVSVAKKKKKKKNKNKSKEILTT